MSKNTDAVTTQRIPREWANWSVTVILGRVVMPVALDAAAALAVTQRIPVAR